MFGMSVDGNYLQKTYEVEGKLGAGGSGEVYKVWHNRLRKHFALKAHKAGIAGLFDTHINEAEALKNLKSSYVPQIFDFFTDEKTSYTIMEYIEGDSFDKLLLHKGKFKISKVTKWYYQLAAALEEIHKKDICHRDIKPSNIMLSKNGDICLIDFDAAIIGDKSTGLISHSHGYASPEQTAFFNICKTVYLKCAGCINTAGNQSKAKEPVRSGSKINWKLSDIYSLGATMHKLLTGVYTTEKENILKITKKNKGLAELEKVINRSMHQKPKERFPSAQKLKHAIAEAMMYY